MKTYYTFTTPPDTATYHPRGHYHWMTITDDPADGYVCVLDSGAEPHPDWTPLPDLLDSSAANFNGVNLTPGAYVAPLLQAGAKAKTAIAGVAHTDSTYQLAKKLAKINKFFHP